MTGFRKFKLNNGLKILIHEDHSTPLVALNLLYQVGSRNEDPAQTGLAHLFEHLMFGGSENIPEFDSPLQLAGGENNAYTNNDFTDYYITIPSENIETAFWLESDRMLGLDLTEKSLEVQKRVVAEEFKQRYLNQPYGDAMLILRPLAYKVHPYRWPTIGMDISHIERVSISQVRDFYNKWYSPDNAILAITGNVKTDDAIRLCEKWFGNIPAGNKKNLSLPSEPLQNEARFTEVVKDVPSDIIYKAWHVGTRSGSEFYPFDLMTDILAGGESGRMYTSLVRDKKLLSDINTYLTGDIDPGLMVVYGKLMNGVDMARAEKEIMNLLEEISTTAIPPYEMEKVKNKFEANSVMANTNIMNKATHLCLFEMLGDAGLINKEVETYRSVTPGQVMSAARQYLKDSNCSTLYYKSLK
jgi:predicted Zn-dependent peptidase